MTTQDLADRSTRPMEMAGKPAVREHRIQHDGGELFCVEQGSGPAVVLIPPGGGDSSTWGDLATILAAGHRVIAYDRRGYSRSSPGARVSLAQHAADAAAIIEHLEAAPATVVGVSAGATIALQLAVTRTELVSGMVLHETPFHGKRHPNLDTIRAIIRMQRMAKRGNRVEAMESFVRWAYTYRTGGSAYDRFPEAWRAVARRNAEATLNDVGFATGESVRRRQLAGLSIPVICTVGELGRPSTYKLMRRLVSWLPRASLEVVAGAGHDVAFDNPMEFARHVNNLAAKQGENTAPGLAG